jgi:hypothetical protein
MFMKAWYGVWAGTNLISSPNPQSLWRGGCISTQPDCRLARMQPAI